MKMKKIYYCLGWILGFVGFGIFTINFTSKFLFKFKSETLIDLTFTLIGGIGIFSGLLLISLFPTSEFNKELYRKLRYLIGQILLLLGSLAYLIYFSYFMSSTFNEFALEKYNNYRRIQIYHLVNFVSIGIILITGIILFHFNRAEKSNIKAKE